MKISLIVMILSMTLFAVADNNLVNNSITPTHKEEIKINGTNVLDKAERRRIRRERRLMADGGLVTKPYTGKYIKIVNMTPRVATSDLDTIRASMSELLNFPILLVSNETKWKSPFDAANKIMSEQQTGAAVILLDDSVLPAIVVMPEESCTIVNARALGLDFPPKEVIKDRIQKEVLRGLAWALGAGESPTKPCMMGYAPTLSALDTNKTKVPSPDPLMKMVNGGIQRGIDTIRIDTYRNACEEGWAPAPTNDVQKAIWDKVHALPTEPLTIKPETKPVKE